MKLAWDSNSKNYYSFNIDKNCRDVDGAKTYELNYQASIDNRIYQIKIDLDSEQAENLNDESRKDLVLEVANQVHQLFSQNPKKKPAEIHYANGQADVTLRKWKNREVSQESTDLPSLAGRITTFSASEVLTKNDYDLIKSSCKSGAKVGLRKLITKVLKILFEVPRYKRELTTLSLKQHLDILRGIPLPQRAGFLNSVEQFSALRPEWLPALFLIYKKDPQGESCDSWSTLIRGGASFADLQAEFEALDIDVNTADPKYETLLTAALKEGRPDFALDLLRSGKFTHINDAGSYQTPIQMASEKGYTEVVKELLKWPNLRDEPQSNNSHPVKRAIQAGRTTVLQTFLKSDWIQDWNEGGITFFGYACAQGKKEIVQLLMKHREKIDINAGEHMCGLERAIRSNKVEIVKLLLGDERTDVNNTIDDRHPPLLACYLEDNREAIFELLLSHPNIDIDPLLNYLKNNPAEVESPYFTLLNEKFPDQCQALFASNSSLQIYRSFKEGKEAEADLLLAEALSSETPFDPLSLINAGEELAPFIRKHAQTLARYVLDRSLLDTLSVKDQRKLLFYIFPDFNRYLDLEKGILAPKGIDIVLKTLRDKGSLPAAPVTVCRDRNTFTDKLRELAQNPALEPGYTHQFIVSKYDENPLELATHVTPIFLKKELNGWQIVITDSTTDYTNLNKQESSCAPLTACLETVEREHPKSFKISTIQRSVFWRQADSFSCPIFALRDTLYFAKHGDEFLEKHKTSSKITTFSTFPPELMKSTQSITEIEDYAKRPEGKILMKTRKPHGQETILEHLKRHRQYNSSLGKDRTNYATDRAKKYEKIVLSHVVDLLRSQVHASN